MSQNNDTQARADATLKQLGKSFAWAAMLLPRDQAQRAARLYAVCREIDDLADTNHPEIASQELQALRAALKQEATHWLADEIAGLQRSTDLSLPSIMHLIDGVEQDTRTVRVASEEELIQYAYRVAGTVGLMMCDVMGVADRQARLHAIDLGIALQLTNIARDVCEDAQMDRRYIPGDWLDMGPHEILNADPDDQKAVRGAIKRLLLLAERYYRSGRAGIDYLPAKSRRAIAVAAAVYREIGVVLQERDFDYLSGRATVPVWRKALVTLRTLTRLAPQQPCPPPHDASLQRALNALCYAQP